MMSDDALVTHCHISIVETSLQKCQGPGVGHWKHRPKNPEHGMSLERDVFA